MTGVPVGAGRFHRTEGCVDDQTYGTVGGEARSLVHHAVGWARKLRRLIDAQKIDVRYPAVVGASPITDVLPVIASLPY